MLLATALIVGSVLSAGLVEPAVAAAAGLAVSRPSATAGSQGLAVTLRWAAVPGASSYRVYRASDPQMPADETTYLGSGTVPEFVDDHETAGKTLFYRVRAVGAGGDLDAPSPVTSTTTTDETAGSRTKALAWLTAQQESTQGFRTTFDHDYPATHSGRVEGHVQDVAQLPAAVAVPAVAFLQSYADDYAGPVEGTWSSVSSAAYYRVDVYSRTDQEYQQGSFALQPDGTWSSGSTTVRAGAKVAYLVRISDGERVARSGGPTGTVPGVAVEVYTRTDVDYLLATVPLTAGGAFSVDGVDAKGGTLIARLVNTTTGRVLNSTEWAASSGYHGLVRSFDIPFGDPAYGYQGGADRRTGYRLEQRSWIYDDALAVLAFTASGEVDEARNVLTQLAALQQPDGSLAFSYDVYRGQLFQQYVRTGALAWVGTSALAYEEQTGDDTYRAFAARIGDYLLGLQVSTANGYSPDDRRSGSLLGGSGRYDDDYDFVPGAMPWASTEHNIDAYFFLRDLGHFTADERYTAASSSIKQSLLTNHWNSAEGRFNQGVAASGADDADALDVGSWGGLFLIAVGEQVKAEQSARYVERFRVDGAAVERSADANSYNQAYAAAGPIGGYKPYDRGYPNPPGLVWTEGTFGALLLEMRLGQDVTADLQSMQRLQAADPEGGFVQVNRASVALPYEFHVWPAVGATAWGVLLMRNAGLLWHRDGWFDTAEPTPVTRTPTPTPVGDAPTATPTTGVPVPTQTPTPMPSAPTPIPVASAPTPAPATDPPTSAPVASAPPPVPVEVAPTSAPAGGRPTPAPAPARTTPPPAPAERKSTRASGGVAPSRPPTGTSPAPGPDRPGLPRDPAGADDAPIATGGADGPEVTEVAEPAGASTTTPPVASRPAHGSSAGAGRGAAMILGAGLLLLVGGSVLLVLRHPRPGGR